MEIPFIVNARKDTGLFNSKVGIWLFLASEVTLFGGLFSGYLFYDSTRITHGQSAHFLCFLV